ncbi:MAG: hypothetical protein L0Z50_14915 [Verrucomicrobiales bacterium]|nr:hypothetical protein [Verrucomicrobiales bacterium]
MKDRFRCWARVFVSCSLFLNAGALGAENTSPLTWEQFKRLAETEDVLGADLLPLLVKRRFGFEWNYSTITNLQGGKVSSALIQRMEDLYTQTIHRAAADAILTPNPAARLPNLATNLPLLGTSLSSVGTNLANAGTNVAALGRIMPAFGTNITTFGTDITTIGTNLTALGEKLAAADPPSVPYSAFFSSGAKFLSPYTVNVISNSIGALDKSGSSTVPFLEFTYLNRYVLRSSGEGDDELKKGAWLGAYPVNPFTHLPDITSHIGFTFGNGTGPTNYSASTIAGAGDFYSDASVGLPFLRRATPSQRQQVSLELAGGVITEKDFVAVHPNVFVGLEYQTSFRPRILSSSTNLSGFLSGRAGVGWIDIPRMTSTTTNIAVDVSGGLPVFDLKPHPCIGVLFAYPLTDALFLNVSGNAYIREDPADWNISVGVSIPFDKVASMIKLPFGAQ